MAGPLLETKLHQPRPRRGLVARSRLGDRLSRGVESTLTLVSAPAGFGKTTVLTAWLAATPTGGRTTAWVSLDERDNDPSVFWSYVIAALEAAVPGVGAGARALLESSPAPTEDVLATLLNDLHAVPDDVVLVLDDYHVIEAPDVQEGVSFLVEHLPPQVHLVVASRADPALPLARLRARGELVELRAADLRFTPDEAAAYLNGAMGLDLTAHDVAALEGRTEGWIAALQLAALSMQGRDDVAGFIAGFAGDDRYIVDYLVGEVLERQPEPVRRFLLDTSVLHRLNGSLCDAVTGQAAARATLEALDRANMFLVPLDDRRHWYRYHHLFADVLRARLLDEQPDRVPVLHRRASDWFEQHDDRAEAIHHALAGGHVGRAADLIEPAVRPMLQARQEATARAWMEALPDELFQVRPVLSISLAGLRMVSGETDGVEELLRAAERWLGPSPDGGPTPMVVVDEAELPRLPGTIALYRAGLARVRGDDAGTFAQVRRALDLAAEDDHLGRGSAAGMLALAHWTTGDLDAAHHWYADAKEHLVQAGSRADAVGCTLALADIRIAQGRLHDAMRTCEQGLQLATAPVLRGAADMHVAMSELFRERNRLDAAAQHLQASRDLGEQAGLPQNAYRWRVAMAGLRAAHGDLDGALDLLDEAERRYVGDYFPEVRPIAALRARVWVAQGRHDDALGWARERGLSVDDDLGYLREFEHVTLARALLARHPDEAVRFLERLLAAAEEGRRAGSVVEILVVLALAHQAGEDRAAALAALAQALTKAEPEGYVRVFLDQGAPLLGLLRAAGDPAGRILAEAGATGAGPPVQRGLVEPLSGRELEVLRLLRTELNGPEIARELVVSLNTMRTHTKNIFTKLGVTSRRAAVRRAEELGL
jgi:LuxR family maltose regulon positive regulatory protein